MYKTVSRVGSITTIVGLVLLCAAVTSATAVASAVSYGGITGIPAHPRTDEPRSKSIFLHTIDAGLRQRDGVMVVNTTKDPKNILITAVDTANASAGGFACAQKSAVRKSVGSWIALEKTALTLGADQSETVPFTITVPAGIHPGEYNGCIVIEEDADKEGAGVVFTTRVGIRVAITVPGDLVRELQEPKLLIRTQENGDSIAHLTVKNTGTTSIDTDVSLRVRPIPFVFLGKEFGGMYPVLRDKVKEWNFELKRSPWGGLYMITASFAYNADPDNRNRIVQKAPSAFLVVFPTRWALTIEIVALAILLILITVSLIRRKNIARRKARVAKIRQQRAQEGEKISRSAQK